MSSTVLIETTMEKNVPNIPASSIPPILTTTNLLDQPDDPVDPFIINVLDQVPCYVLDYAPLIHLNSNEPFWPANVETHLKHSVLLGPDRKPHQPTSEDPFAILTKPELNKESSFLTAEADVRPSPRQFPWLVSAEGRPGPDRRSAASPAFLIVVDKSLLTGVEGTLDAFWFFFHSFNLGPTVANIRFGNHIADWEHCMMRFENGKPKAVHLSAHADGAAYTYESLEKMDGKRPVVFSALGSHAMYPKPGSHGYSPAKCVGPIDNTDRGPLWDPTLNYAAFQHFPSPARDKFRAIDEAKDGNLVPCLKFRGHWGDEFSRASVGSKRIINILGSAKKAVTLERRRWGDGITGPRDKGLDRVGMNQSGNEIRTSI